MRKRYLCSKSKDDDRKCEFGGLKTYRNGFMNGTAGYCWMKKKWISDLTVCPKTETQNEDSLPPKE